MCLSLRRATIVLTAVISDATNLESHGSRFAERKRLAVTHRLSSAKEAVASISYSLEDLEFRNQQIVYRSTVDYIKLLESLSLKDIMAADWSDNVASFLPAVLCSSVWDQVITWLKLSAGYKPDSVKEILRNISRLFLTVNKGKFVHVVCLLTLWSIWLASAEGKVFNNRNVSMIKLVKCIKETFYYWYLHISSFLELS
ncbi:putative tocopherol C-methyltransferase [Helianthus annuus]|uniref:Tocopherol O-methyltransferase n=1 Tax=Helianthus annuus TaxID=4232 RepID=A0A251VIE4_HELAN|nr:putative tocopherol O-methyltransferase [Helianthus annuus]KAJ0941348.1 putative tocopherol C-methyltransferase [Helianthus annuus]